MATLALEGTFTALVTPFVADGSKIDWDAYGKLVAGQIDGGVSGLVPCGTTGETPTLTDGEQVELVQRTVELAAGRVPVMAGTGSNSTKKTIEASRAALEAGADAVMIVMPYYNKPTQSGMAAHVTEVAGAIDAPVVLYNIPSRSVVDLSNDTLEQILRKCANVVGVKDATGNVLRCQDLLRRVGDRVMVMSGDDALTLGMMCCGARGVISVTSNLYPKAVSDVPRDLRAGRHEDGRAKHYALLPVHEAMFIESNPAPIKAALASQGRMTRAVRLPLLEASEGASRLLHQVMATFEAR